MAIYTHKTNIITNLINYEMKMLNQPNKKMKVFDTNNWNGYLTL